MLALTILFVGCSIMLAVFLRPTPPGQRRVEYHYDGDWGFDLLDLGPLGFGD